MSAKRKIRLEPCGAKENWIEKLEKHEWIEGISEKSGLNKWIQRITRLFRCCCCCHPAANASSAHRLRNVQVWNEAQIESILEWRVCVFLFPLQKHITKNDWAKDDYSCTLLHFCYAWLTLCMCICRKYQSPPSKNSKFKQNFYDIMRMSNPLKQNLALEVTLLSLTKID